jgi:hypothetical protein
MAHGVLTGTAAMPEVGADHISVPACSLRAAPPAAGWSEAGGAVHELTQQGGVAVMAGVFLDMVRSSAMNGSSA